MRGWRVSGWEEEVACVCGCGCEWFFGRCDCCSCAWRPVRENTKSLTPCAHWTKKLFRLARGITVFHTIFHTALVDFMAKACGIQRRTAAASRCWRDQHRLFVIHRWALRTDDHLNHQTLLLQKGIVAIGVGACVAHINHQKLAARARREHNSALLQSFLENTLTNCPWILPAA